MLSLLMCSCDVVLSKFMTLRQPSICGHSMFLFSAGMRYNHSIFYVLVIMSEVHSAPTFIALHFHQGFAHPIKGLRRFTFPSHW